MTPEQRQALRQRIKEACGADLGPCEPPKPEQYWCDACLALAALETAEQENKLLRDNERFKDGLIHDQRQRAEQAEAQLAQAPPRAEAVRVLEEAWWRGRRSVDHLPAVHANGPKLTSMCNNDIASLLPSAALRAEGEGGK